MRGDRGQKGDGGLLLRNGTSHVTFDAGLVTLQGLQPCLGHVRLTQGIDDRIDSAPGDPAAGKRAFRVAIGHPCALRGCQKSLGIAVALPQIKVGDKGFRVAVKPLLQVRKA